MAGIDLGHHREARSAVALVAAVIRRRSHQRVCRIIYGVLLRESLLRRIAVPARRRQVETPRMVVDRSRRIVRRSHAVMLRVHPHRTHHAVVEATFERYLYRSARRIGVVVGARLRDHLDLRDIFGAQIADVLHQLLARETHFAVVDIHLGAARAVHRDLVVVDPHPGRLPQQIGAVLAYRARRVGHVDHETVGLATYHLRRHHHLADRGRRLL